MNPVLVAWDRLLVADAAVHGSAGILLAHNHPCCDPSPSAGDCAITRLMALIGEAMVVAVLDHLVLAGSEYTSMRSVGLLYLSRAAARRA